VTAASACHYCRRGGVGVGHCYFEMRSLVRFESAKRAAILADKFEKEGTKPEFVPGLRWQTDFCNRWAVAERRRKKFKKSY